MSPQLPPHASGVATRRLRLHARMPDPHASLCCRLCRCRHSAGKDGQGNCVKAATELCSKNKTMCQKLAGPLCAATGTYASQCNLAVKAATSPVGGALSGLLG